MRKGLIEVDWGGGRDLEVGKRSERGSERGASRYRQVLAGAIEVEGTRVAMESEWELEGA